MDFLPRPGEFVGADEHSCAIVASAILTGALMAPVLAVILILLGFVP